MSDTAAILDAPWYRQLWYGLGMPFRGARLIVLTPALWPWVVVPVVLTIGLLGFALWAAVSIVPGVIDGWLPVGADHPFVQGLRDAVWWLVWGATLLLVTMAAWMLGNLLAAPFYDRLSDAVERRMGARPLDDEVDWSVVARDVAQGLAHSLLAASLYASTSCLLGLLELIPVAGMAVHLVGSIAAAAFFAARETLDYCGSRRRYTFREKLQLMREHLALVEGLGLGAVALLVIPLANFASMPASVVGATMLFVDLEAAGRMPPPRTPET